MKVIILNGPGEAGKGEFFKQLKQSAYKGKLYKFSSITWAKQVATECFGWMGQKDPLSREMLTNIQQAGIKYANIPHIKLINAMLAYYNYFIFAGTNHLFVTDIREPEEIKKTVNICKNNKWPVLVVRIQNDIKEKEAKQKLGKADNSFACYPYDCIIQNNGTIEDFKNEIKYSVVLWSFLL